MGGFLSALEPGKQGLKRGQVHADGGPGRHLSALDPGKQGLKPRPARRSCRGIRAFSA